MYKVDIENISNSAKQKSDMTKNKPYTYAARSIMAGFYLVVATILSYTSGALMNNITPELGRMATAMTFSVAILLICFLGGELFTGNNLIMGMGLYSKAISIIDLIRVFVLSYVGNFIGSFILGYLFVKSGSNTELLRNYIEPIINTKLNLPPMIMLIRGILCNFIVCISVLGSFKLKEESARMTLMFWSIFAFVIAGFEHSIANMGIYTIGYFLLGELPLWSTIYSMLWVTLGNIIGGMILYAYTLYKMATD